MSTGIRWIIGLGLAPLLGYVALVLYLLVRVGPQPIVVPWKMAHSGMSLDGPESPSEANEQYSRRPAKSVTRVAA